MLLFPRLLGRVVWYGMDQCRGTRANEGEGGRVYVGRRTGHAGACPGLVVISAQVHGETTPKRATGMPPAWGWGGSTSALATLKRRTGGQLSTQPYEWVRASTHSAQYAVPWRDDWLSTPGPK